MTGLRGAYDLEFKWTGDRLTSVSAVLRDRYGLQLTATKREMNTLILEQIHRGPALLVFDHLGRATQNAPLKVRRAIADVISIH